MSFIVVLIELVNEFNEPVLISIESIRFFAPMVVVATLELKLPIELDKEELNPNVVVATEELKLPMDELNPDVVVATLEDKLPMLEVKLNVVVAIEELNVL